MKLHEIIAESRKPPLDGMVIGIDPGITGAIAVYYNGDWSIYDQPSKPIPNRHPSCEYDIAGMIDLMRTIRYQTLAHIQTAAYLEHIHAMPREGKVMRGSIGTWKLAGAFWLWRAILAHHDIVPTLVLPQRWKAFYGLLRQEKEASRMMAMEMFPQLNDKMKFKKHHNRAEALLIAQYGVHEELVKQKKRPVTDIKWGWEK